MFAPSTLPEEKINLEPVITFIHPSLAHGSNCLHPFSKPLFTQWLIENFIFLLQTTGIVVRHSKLNHENTVSLSISYNGIILYSVISDHYITTKHHVARNNVNKIN